MSNYRLPVAGTDHRLEGTAQPERNGVSRVDHGGGDAASGMEVVVAQKLQIHDLQSVSHDVSEAVFRLRDAAEKLRMSTQDLLEATYRLRDAAFMLRDATAGLYEATLPLALPTSEDTTFDIEGEFTLQSTRDPETEAAYALLLDTLETDGTLPN